MLENLLAILAPHECIRCGYEGSLLCLTCQRRLSSATGRCYRCRALSTDGRTCEVCRRRSHLYAVSAAADYDNRLATELVRRLKFNGARAAAKEMAAIMVGLLPALPADTLIVHLPTASRRVRQRGYDQAALLAREVARLIDRPYVACMARIGQQRQVGATRAQRLSQLERSLRVTKPLLVRGRTVLLIDDVTTTGASLETAATALKTVGAKRVIGAVFARA